MVSGAKHELAFPAAIVSDIGDDLVDQFIARYFNIECGRMRRFKASVD